MTVMTIWVCDADVAKYRSTLAKDERAKFNSMSYDARDQVVLAWKHKCDEEVREAMDRRYARSEALSRAREWASKKYSRVL